MIIQLFSDEQLRRRDIDSLKVLLRNRLGGYTVAIKYITTDNYVFRGVCCPVRPTSVDRISYPPPDRVAQDGRVNRAGTSMFYCSAAAAAVFFELRAKKGDRIALSRWDVLEPLWMHNLGYHRLSLQKIGARDHRLTDLIHNETKENEQLRRRLSLAFTKDIREGQEYKYKQSIAINELLFDKAGPLPTIAHGPRFDRAAGTIYPTMQMRGGADNLVILPEFVDSSMRINFVRYVVVEDVDEARFAYTFLILAEAHNFSGKEIIWEELDLPDIQRRNYISFEEGKWTLRDGFNRIYDQH